MIENIISSMTMLDVGYIGLFLSIAAFGYYCLFVYGNKPMISITFHGKD